MLLTRSKKTLLRKISVLEDKTFSKKNRDQPSYAHKIFRYQEVSKTQKGSPKNVFGTVIPIFFDTKSWYPRYVWFLIPETFRNTKKVPSWNFPWKKVFDIFWWYPPIADHKKHALDRWPAVTLTWSQLVLVTVQFFSKRKLVNSLVQFCLFKNLRKSCELPVADLISSFVIHTYSLTTDG